MDTKLEALILKLENFIRNESVMISGIAKPDLLLNSLKKLNAMIGMRKVKDSIVDMISFIIVNSKRNRLSDASIMDDHMCHMVITGDPGTGKTTLAKILAEIWCFSGAIKPFPKISQEKERKFKLNKDTKEVKEDMDRVLFEYYKNGYNEAKHKLITYQAKMKDIDDAIKENNIAKISEIIKDVVPPLIVSSESCNVKFIVAKKNDLVGEYSGHTSPKTKALLDSALGGVLLIDEFYNLHNDSEGRNKDTFGAEAMTMINEYMSLYSPYLVVIFAGYKDLIEKNTYQAQRGLERRITWRFDLPNYSIKELSEIFQIQLIKNGWSLSPDIDIVSLFVEFNFCLKCQTGDTERLTQFCKQIHDRIILDLHYENLGDLVDDKIITKSILRAAFGKLIELKGDNH